MTSCALQVCDCLVVDCFKLDGHSVFSSGTVADLLQKVCHVSPGKDNKENVQLLLLDPTTQLSHYSLRLQVVQLFNSSHPGVRD